MGPSTIFDKSALQALSVDESVWFEAFFSAILVPVFYVETLADLEKNTRGRDPEDVVGRLAEKTPANAAPIVFHRDLLLSELGGNELDLVTRRPVLRGGKVKRAPDGAVGVHFDDFPEAVALQRWQAREFEEVERTVAKKWRSSLAEHDPQRVIGMVKNILPTDTKISDLAQLKELIDGFCDSTDPHVLQLALAVLDVPPDHQAHALARWGVAGQPALPTFAPYTTHCFKVDLLYHLGMLRSFISGERASNRADMEYLYYLPFASVFVSGDKLHQRTVPLFARPDQSYIPHTGLKAALRDLDDHYNGLPDEVKQLGVLSFAAYPPLDRDGNLVPRLWDLHMSSEWRAMAERHQAKLHGPRDEEAEREMVAELNHRMREAQAIEDGDSGPVLDDDGPEYMVITRHVFPTKGKWRIVPEEAEDVGGKPGDKAPPA
ncbi:hypothetical protein [Baekduia sp.]|jgi:hypothetical protein|uniref:hypothetical protein n=1 Tax=Baekduia sp. TaxID=2600305 RepID=UPI002E020EC7|nr:hypothetical protein [Baekduia sp.]